MSRVAKIIILLSVFASIYGCRGGGGAGSGSGQSSSIQTISTESSPLSTEQTISGAKAADGSSPSESGQGGDIATLHQPEPASMLLLGSGMLAMALYKRSTKRTHKKS